MAPQQQTNPNPNASVSSSPGGSSSVGSVTAAGGSAPQTDQDGIYIAGNGGSGGGAVFCSGGTDGGNGVDYNIQSRGGSGQGTTTRAFGETSGTLYSNGGNGGTSAGTIAFGCGSGGTGGCTSTITNTPKVYSVTSNSLSSGSSGIVIIRWGY